MQVHANDTPFFKDMSIFLWISIEVKVKDQYLLDRSSISLEQSLCMKKNKKNSVILGLPLNRYLRNKKAIPIRF